MSVGILTRTRELPGAAIKRIGAAVSGAFIAQRASTARLIDIHDRNRVFQTCQPPFVGFGGNTLGVETHLAGKAPIVAGESKSAAVAAAAITITTGEGNALGTRRLAAISIIKNQRRRIFHSETPFISPITSTFYCKNRFSSIFSRRYRQSPSVSWMLP